MLTVAELPEFIRTADKLLSETERQDVISNMAEHPCCRRPKTDPLEAIVPIQN